MISQVRCLSPSASTLAETLQLDAGHGRDYLSRSAQIDKGAVCDQQGTVTRIAVIDPPAADSADVLRCTSASIEGGPDGHTGDDTAAAMDGVIMDRGRGVQNMMAGGDAGQHTTQVNNTLPAHNPG